MAPSLRPALSVVVPLFNEVTNVEPLCRRLLPVLRNLGVSFELLLVDDGSRDGTLAELLRLRGEQRELIVLSLARMNRIKEISRDDFVAVVQPGVKTERLQLEVEKRGLFYPPDPASRADSFIGGNIATNAGGPRCLKYGVTRDYVLGLEVVLANGTVVRVGGRTHKNKTGFDLVKLFIGSEGMLGIVTEAILKLLPLPPYRACLGVGLQSMRSALKPFVKFFPPVSCPARLRLPTI